MIRKAGVPSDQLQCPTSSCQRCRWRVDASDVGWQEGVLSDGNRYPRSAGMERETPASTENGKLLNLSALVVYTGESSSDSVRSLVLCRPMKWAGLKALQISNRRPSLRRVCTLKVTLTHLNMHQFTCRHRCSEKTKIHRATPGGLCSASPVSRPRYSFRQHHHGQRSAILRSHHKNKQGTDCDAAKSTDKAHWRCTLSFLHKLQHPLGIRI